MSKMRKIVLVLRIFFSINDRFCCGVKKLLYNEKITGYMTEKGAEYEDIDSCRYAE